MMKTRLLLAVLVGYSARLSGAPITFFGEDLNGNPAARISFPNASQARANFSALLPLTATDSFEEFAQGDQLRLTLAFGGLNSADLTGDSGSIQSLSSGTDGFGEFPTSGMKYLSTNAASLRLAFTNPVSAFGFYATDIGDFGGQLSLVFTRAAGGTVTVPVPHSLGTGPRSPQDGSVLFFGFVDTANPFTAVSLQDTAISDSFGFDDPIIGIRTSANVPEPASLLLFAGGLSGLLVARRAAKRISKR